MRRIFLLFAILLAAPAAAQQRGFTVDEIVDLLRNQVASERVLFLVQQRCIHFEPDDAALARITAAGGTAELREGLRARGQCSTLARGPVRRERAAARPADAPRDSSITGLLSLVYSRSTLGPRGGGAAEEGQGGALELGAAGRHVGVFLHLGIVDVNPEGAPDYTRGDWAAGLRFFPWSGRWPVRPYADVSGAFIEMAYYDDDNETERTIQGWGAEVGGGVMLRIAPALWLDVAHRRLRGSYTEDDWENGPPPGHEFTPIRGTVSRWTAGLTFAP